MNSLTHYLDSLSPFFSSKAAIATAGVLGVSVISAFAISKIHAPTYHQAILEAHREFDRAWTYHNVFTCFYASVPVRSSYSKVFRTQ